MTSVFDGLPDIFTGALGQAVTVTPVGGSARSITAIFRRRPMLTLGDDVQQTQPVIQARSVDVSDLTDGATVVVGADSFKARVFSPDGKGMTTVILEEA